MDNVSIKENIRKIRQKLRLTQEDMAHRLNISITAYRDLEKGRTSILNSYVGLLADVFETSTEELVLGYRPSQIAGRDIREVQEEYQSKVINLERRIEDLEKVITLLEENIESKKQIISMLQK
ncbi:MAG: helix-turn-helix transcriptional regulator [Bacteroidales bacterium]|nr:helix-turn-helix transcriptional regulator [Bacteroidales bacterium]